MKKHTRRRLGGSRSDSRNEIGSPARSKSKTKKNDKEFLEEGASAETINDELQFHSDEKAAPKSYVRAEAPLRGATSEAEVRRMNVPN